MSVDPPFFSHRALPLALSFCPFSHAVMMQASAAAAEGDENSGSSCFCRAPFTPGMIQRRQAHELPAWIRLKPSRSALARVYGSLTCKLGLEQRHEAASSIGGECRPKLVERRRCTQMARCQWCFKVAGAKYRLPRNLGVTYASMDSMEAWWELCKAILP